MSAGNTQKGTRFRAPFSVFSDAKGTLIEIVDADGVITAAISDAPTGDVVIATAKTLTVTDSGGLLIGTDTVEELIAASVATGGADDVVIATAKTLAVTDADKLTVGGVIVPQTLTLVLNQAQFGNVAFVAPWACKVVSVKERHTTAESTAATLTGMLKKVPSGTAIASGTDCLSAGSNLKSTADTNVTGSLHATAGNYTLAAGDGLGIKLSTTVTELAGSSYTVELKRV